MRSSSAHISALVATLLLILPFQASALSKTPVSSCNYSLVESIPEGLILPFEQPKIGEQLIRYVNNVKSSLDIAEFYFSLLCKDVVDRELDTCQTGEQLLSAIVNATKRNVQVRIAVNGQRTKDMNDDLKMLEEAGAEIKFLNFDALVGAGVLHTKFLIFDDDKFFLGSANMDWRSFTQVKELGIITNQCFELTQDLLKIFEVYWLLGDQGQIPASFPSNLSTKYNRDSPLSVNLNNDLTLAYLTSSPPQFSPAGRTNDLDGLLSVIHRAKKFVYLSVMDYSPTFLYSKSHAYWPVIDSALREAAVTRGVEVRLILGYWNHTRPDILKYLASLNMLKDMNPHKGTIKIKLFKVPITNPVQKMIPYSRVDHAKFMITDKQGFIGTSNWSADYFLNTGGVSLITQANQTSSIPAQLKAIFLRDWESEYAHDLDD